jgi:CRISPR/Cas system-associated exonuclease Cas4 (RecB family)
MGFIANIRYGKKVLDVKKLANLVEASYLELGRKPGHVQKTSFAPSSIGYQHHKCARKWVLAFRGAQFDEVTNAQSISVMEAGTDSHERIQEAFRRAGILQEKELELITTNPPTRGFVDAVIDFDGEPVVVEVKTTNNSNFTYRKGTNTPTPYHRYQILIYMHGLNIKKGALFYENRDSGEILIIPIELDSKNKEILDEALEWMREVYKAYENDKLPTRAGKNSDSVICRQCPVNNVCWNQESDGDIKIKTMKVHDG